MYIYPLQLIPRVTTCAFRQKRSIGNLYTRVSMHASMCIKRGARTQRDEIYKQSVCACLCTSACACVGAEDGDTLRQRHQITSNHMILSYAVCDSMSAEEADLDERAVNRLLMAIRAIWPLDLAHHKRGDYEERVDRKMGSGEHRVHGIIHTCICASICVCACAPVHVVCVCACRVRVCMRVLGL